MRIYEYQAKRIFLEKGIHVPEGRVTETPWGAEEIAKKLGSVAIKAQVHIGGRMKAGGIKFADSSRRLGKWQVRFSG